MIDKLTSLLKAKSFRLLVITLMLVGFFFLSCGQNSIFFDISNEPEPKDPIIPGSPTNLVVVRNRLFVGNRMGNKIYSYGYNGNTGALEWSSLPLPLGSLGDLATDGTDLFVLSFPSKDPLKSSMVRRYNVSANSWDTTLVLGAYLIQTLHGVNGRIFAGAQHYSNYQDFAIMYYQHSSNSFAVIKNGTTLLKGAAENSSGRVYLATAGSGMFLFNEGSLDISEVSGTGGANFAGLTSVGGVIIGVTADGDVYSNVTGGFAHVGTGVNYTGAMCLWFDRENLFRPSLLLMGIRGKGTSYAHGYREMVLNNGLPTYEIKTPGNGSPTSVRSKAKYEASIGTHAVESILQLPDATSGGPLYYRDFAGDPQWEPPIFASTSKSGLWSYRNGEWNAED